MSLPFSQLHITLDIGDVDFDDMTADLTLLMISRPYFSANVELLETVYVACSLSTRQNYLKDPI